MDFWRASKRFAELRAVYAVEFRLPNDLKDSDKAEELISGDENEAAIFLRGASAHTLTQG
jgi:hypothetical protein